MKEYKVLVIKLLLKNNKLASNGEIVTVDQLTDSAEKLVSEGYLVEIGDEGLEVGSEKSVEELAAEEAAKTKAEDEEKAAQALAEAQKTVADEKAKSEAEVGNTEAPAPEAAAAPSPADLLKKGK